MPLPTSPDIGQRFREGLPEEPTRAELEAFIIQRATNDATIWKLLVNPATTRDGLKAVFGAAPPAGVNVTVKAEDATTFYHVVPAPEEAEQTVGPRTLAPRQSFTRRINYLLHTDPQFKAAFENHPASAVAKAFQFRFPSHVAVVPLPESRSTTAAGDATYDLFVVLPYDAHDALFDKPYALAFNGTDACVTVPGSPSLVTKYALSVEAWFKADAFRPGNWQDAVVSMHGDASGWELRVGGAVPRFMVTVNGVHYYAQPANPVPFLKPGTWYYVVGTYDGLTLQLRLNGDLLYRTPVSGPITPYVHRLTIGCNSNPAWGGRFFAGEVDEVRVWARALAEPEVRQYRPRKARGAAPDAADAALRAYYPMAEGNGPALPDHSQYGNTGTLVKAEWVTIPDDAP